MGSNAVLPPRGATWDLQSHGAGDAKSTATSCLMGISKSAYYIDSPAFIVYKTFILVQLHSSSVVTKNWMLPLPGSWRHDDVSELPE